MRPFLPFLGLLGLACGDSPTQPGTGSVSGLRTVLFYREDTGQNFLLNSDGTAERVAAIGDSGLVPVGHAPQSLEIAFLEGNALIVINLNDPGRRDTLIYPVPGSISPVGFSPDGRKVAMYQYQPEPRLLVFDRDAGGTDTIATADIEPDLPPAFSPEGDRVALLTITPLSVILTVVVIEDGQLLGGAAGFSRFIYQPVFGWPRWTEEGILVGTVRTGDDADTLTVIPVHPDTPSDPTDPLFRVVSPRLIWDAGSSWALSPDGRAVVLAAQPGVTTRRHLYYGVRGGRLSELLENPAAQPAFPLVLP